MKTYTEEFKKTIVELYENGNKNKSELAREYGTSEGNVRAWIKKYGKIKTSTGEVTSNDEILKLQKENQEIKVPFDYGFVCLGMKAYNPLYLQLKDYYQDKNGDVLEIGDCKRARRIIEGTQEGRNSIHLLK